MNERTEQFKAILADEAAVRDCLAAENAGTVQKILADKGLEMSLEEIEALGSLLADYAAGKISTEQIEKAAGGELTEDELAQAAGGRILQVLVPLAGIMTVACGVLIDQKYNEGGVCNTVWEFAKDKLAINRW
ncbi:MAG: hypothetical protein IKN55_10920 [Oscillospiraceae bacterium]|nr:hypothetical protein [Oscillospiraceae bacterium]